MRVLLVEPWFAGSHRHWVEGYCRASVHDIDVVSLPGVTWRWRLRGGALPLAAEMAALIGRVGPPDVVLVSGLVDVAHLIGLTRRLIGPVPVVTYQHESQLVHPVGRDDGEAALRNWLSWCASDAVVFNSEFHRGLVVDALPGYLERLPDRSHRPMLDDVLSRFTVVPVGVDRIAGGDRPAGRPPVILWPHRWERDKNPDVFAAALARVEECGLDFGLVLAGQTPEAGSDYADASRAAVAERFAHRVVASGPFAADDYRALVADADIVVSCADHEFFGVAVVEAIGAGCVPLLPAALSYPELVGHRWRDVALYQPGSFGSALLQAVTDHERRRQRTRGLAISMDRYAWSNAAAALDQVLADVASRLG